MIDIIWKDRVLKNPRKIKLKDLNSKKIIECELQDDPENIIEDSDTPINATTLNMMTNAINNQLLNIDTFNADVNKRLEDYKKTKDGEIDAYKNAKNQELEDYKTQKTVDLDAYNEQYKKEFNEKLSNLGSNYVQVIAVEEYTVK